MLDYFGLVWVGKMVFGLIFFVETEPALRGEAALKVRQTKEARKNATITPCERSFSDSSWNQFRLDEPNLPLEGELVQCAQNGKSYSSISQDWFH